MLYQMYRKDPRLAAVKEGIFDDHGDPENCQKHLDALKVEQPKVPRAMRPLHQEMDDMGDPIGEGIDNEDTGHVRTDTPIEAGAEGTEGTGTSTEPEKTA